ncbi:MAG TPA: serine/threonine-protein kinase [Myxococcaceae bacterium]|jgi:serine/threonine protein kinase
MDRPEVHPTALPLGTRVGSWQVTGFRDRGVYGTVYRAVQVGHSRSRPVALKLAIYPADPRFEREEELLSRIRHPSVPRLLDAGQWLDGLGRVHPFLVMEWAEGLPLYEWAAQRNPSSRQVLAVLAQAAGALQATHEVSSVHRDVKGSNMLVRPSDGWLFLTDFGSGHYAGAARLTPQPVQPSTPAYRSPQLWRYDGPEAPGAPFSTLARPSDDVFALGVTAYRLVTDTYPPTTDPASEEARCWQPGGGGTRPPRQLNPRMDAQLNALIARMLSPRPEERGIAGELGEAMRRGVLGHRPRRRDRERATVAEQADAARREEQEQRKAQVLTCREAPAQLKRSRSWVPWLTAVLALGLWPEQPGRRRTSTAPTIARSESTAEHDAVSLGKNAQPSSAAKEKPPAQALIAMEFPKKPRPGQRRPDANGQCPAKQVAINGGCWIKVDFTPEDCILNGFAREGSCYLPVYESSPGPTSAPQNQ